MKFYCNQCCKVVGRPIGKCFCETYDWISFTPLKELLDSKHSGVNKLSFMLIDLYYGKKLENKKNDK